MRRGLPHLNELFKTLRFGNHAARDLEAEAAGHAAGLGRQFQTDLVYLGAGDLAALALACESRELAPAVREGFDWPSVFDSGQVRPETLLALLPGEES